MVNPRGGRPQAGSGGFGGTAEEGRGVLLLLELSGRSSVA